MRQMMKKPVSKLRTVFAVKEAYSGLLLFFRAFRAWRKGDYPLFPKKTILLAALAFIYVLSPIDLIPDVLAGVGWLDDAAVLAFLFSTKELDGFETHLTGRVNYNGKQ
ncbi:YkvA family protein [Bacillus licheniformis]|uniref:YkvA family protein n=1 Tax=Bacillus licheniformis TaxID=1402 RepID=UPI0011A7B50B|nr:YkvA family protein [Bacillus licheniformis]